MDQFELIRRMVLVDGLSVREVARRLGHARKTIRKALQHATPIPYRVDATKPRPKLDPFVEIIRTWLTDDQQRPRKQRHTAVRIWERLRDEHQYDGARRAVSDLVKQLRRELAPPEVFVPIDHPPGNEFQIDWGEVTIELNTVTTKVMIFCARSTFLPITSGTYIAARSHMQKVDRQSTVTCDSARYSVPTKYACLPVVVRAFYDRIEVICKDQIIASHRRIESGGWSLELEHYLPILERKPGLLDSGIPFKKRAWSDAERLLRRELEYRLGEEGTRQFLSIVLLSKTHPWKLVREAITRCVALRAFHEAGRS